MARRPHYNSVMTRSYKNLLAMLLAIVAMAAMSLSAAQAGRMTVEMSGMADGMNAYGDCVTPCPGEQDDANSMACPPVCVAPVVAVVPSVMMLDVASTSLHSIFPYSRHFGRESLPDPYPPRTRAIV